MEELDACGVPEYVESRLSAKVGGAALESVSSSLGYRHSAN